MREPIIKAEMNFVPFIDVMLVLLIIFMVTSQTIKVESSIDVNLPQKLGSSVESVEIKVDTIVVTMSNNSFFLSSTYFSISDKNYKTSSEISIAIKALVVERPKSKVYLRADKDISYGDVTGLIDLLALNGVTGVSLVLGDS